VKRISLKLRTKFLFLIIGVTLIPFLVISVVFFFQITETPFRSVYASYLKSKHWVERYLAHPEENDAVELLEKIADSRPKGLEVIYMSSNDRVLFSTVGEIGEGSLAVESDIFNLIRRNTEKYEFQIIPFRSPSDSGIFLVLTPRLTPVAGSNLKNILNNMRFFTIVGVPLVLILFTAFMSFYIIRSIRKQIDTLENATRRIADGDLDFTLDIRGRDEIASLARSFDMMRARLKEEYARRARLIMGISHDLKTPLALIEGYADAITDGYADSIEKLKDYVAIIKEKSILLEERIGKLIDFVRLETGDWKLMHREVAIGAFLKDFARRYSEDARLLGFDFNYSVDIPAGIRVSMDPELFQRALENLVSNAIRYSGERKEIEFKAYHSEEGIMISITNYGSPLTPEEMKLIFEPFYRGSPSRREEGLGLGLHTVRYIVDSHGWAIDVKSEDGKPSGKTTFTITINL